MLRKREEELRTELLTAQRENLTLRLDYEQAVLELPRLKVSSVRGIYTYVHQILFRGLRAIFLVLDIFVCNVRSA